MYQRLEADANFVSQPSDMCSDSRDPCENAAHHADAMKGADMADVFDTAEMNEANVIAEIYEQIAALPHEQQLRVLEFVWLNAASHARTAQLAVPGKFSAEREK